MKTINATVALAAIFAIVSPAFSQEKDADYYTVAGEEVTLTETLPGGDAVPPQLPLKNPVAAMNKSGAAGGIVNAGMAAWSVINSGAPSAGYASAYASAIPGFGFNWGNVTEWKGPKEMVYTYKVKNLYGINVIDVKYKISFFYGGTEDYSGKGRLDDYVSVATGNNVSNSGRPDDGKIHGRYITNFTVQPISVNVLWGWHFDLAVRMSDPMNIGTKMHPVAALYASLNWIRKTPLATDGGTFSYSVDGLGNFKDMTPRSVDVGDVVPTQLSETPTVDWN